MAGQALLPKGETIGRRFQSLAEERRRHLLELYRTGRWRHHYTEDQLALEMRDAGRLIDSWKKFAKEQANAPEVESAGIAPDEPEGPSIQPDADRVTDVGSSDRPVPLLHD
jgi:uncharacterized repeat protein (TIGR03809 family)